MITLDKALIIGEGLDISGIDLTLGVDLDLAASQFVPASIPLALNIVAATTIAKATNADPRFLLRTATNLAGLAAGKIIADSQDIDAATADIPAGTVLASLILPRNVTMARARVAYDAATAFPASGTVDVWIGAPLRLGMGIRDAIVLSP